MEKEGKEWIHLKKIVEITIYGAAQICPSCVNLPSSMETYEWLEAAIARKFPNQDFKMTYVDILNPPGDEEKKAFAKRVIEEDLFYPVVLLEDEIIAEGNPRIKTIFEKMQEYGYIAQ